MSSKWAAQGDGWSWTVRGGMCRGGKLTLCHVMPIRPFADFMHFRVFYPLPLLVSYFFSSNLLGLFLTLIFQANRSGPLLLLPPSRLVAMLRRRTGKDEVPPSNTTKPEKQQLHAEFVDTKVTQLVIKPRSKRRNGFIFMLGGIFGIFVALFFANQQEVISLDSLMDLNLDSWIEAIPQGIVSDVKEFSVRDF